MLHVYFENNACNYEKKPHIKTCLIGACLVTRLTLNIREGMVDL